MWHNHHEVFAIVVTRATQIIMTCVGVIVLTTAVRSQPVYTVTDIGARGGLPDRVCLSLVVDSIGYAWVGTRAGLFRYDGRGFSSYPFRVSGESNSLTKAITALALDGDSALWVGTPTGLYWLNRSSGLFTRVNDRISHVYTLSVLSGRLWVAHSAGVSIADSSRSWKSILAVQGGDRIGMFTSRRFFAWQGDTVLLMQGAGSQLVFSRDRFVEHQPARDDPTIDGYGGSLFFAMLQAGQKRAYIKTGERWVDAGSLGRRLIRNSRGRITILDIGFMCYLDDDSSVVTSVRLSRSLRRFFEVDGSDISKWVLAADGESILAATDRGLYRIHPGHVETIELDPEAGYGHEEEVRSLYQDTDGSLYAGCTSGKFYRVTFRDQTGVEVALQTRTPTLPNVLLRHGGTVLSLGTHSGLYGIAPRISPPLWVPRFLGGQSIYGVCTDTGESWLVPTVDKFTGNSMLYSVYGARLESNTPLLSQPFEDPIWCVYKDARNVIWVGTKTGLGVVEDRAIRRIRLESDGSGEPVSDVWSITEDEGGRLWVGSWSHGLHICTVDKAIVKLKDVRSVPVGAVQSILSSRDGSMWVATRTKTVWLSPGARSIRELTAADGLHNGDFFVGASLKLADGRIAFGGGGGISVIDPRRFDHSPSISKLLINDVAVNNRLHTRELRFDSTLFLQPDESTLGFTVSVLNQDIGVSGSLQYRVVGTSTHWSPVSSDRRIVVELLDAGEYTIEVRGIDDLGNQLYYAAVSVTKRQVWYQSSWTYASGGILLAAALILAVWYRGRSEARWESSHKQISELELQTLRLQMNPHFLFNTLNAVQGAVLSGNPRHAAPILSKLARLMRETLELSRERFITLEQELRIARLYTELEQSRFSHGFDISWEIDEEVVLTEVLIPPLLLQPFIENAIIHGLAPLRTGGLLWVTIAEVDGIVTCRIRDNGVGRERSERARSRTGRSSTSMGLDVTLKRIDLLNRVGSTTYSVRIIDNHDSEGDSTGTEVVIAINQPRNST